MLNWILSILSSVLTWVQCNNVELLLEGNLNSVKDEISQCVRFLGSGYPLLCVSTGVWPSHLKLLRRGRDSRLYLQLLLLLHGSWPTSAVGAGVCGQMTSEMVGPVPWAPSKHCQSIAALCS